MYEDAYRSTRAEINPLACPFEKAVLLRCCNCELASRKNIAERETVSCASAIARENCLTLRALLRANALFALKMTQSEPLPHGKEIKVQCGGLKGLLQVLRPEGNSVVDNIHSLVLAAQEQYTSLTDIPYGEIVKYIAAYEARRRR